MKQKMVLQGCRGKRKRGTETKLKHRDREFIPPLHGALTNAACNKKEGAWRQRHVIEGRVGGEQAKP